MVDALRQRGHILFTMLTACAWRNCPAGPPPIVAGLRAFLGGWLGIGRIVGMARHGYDIQLTLYGDEGSRATFYPAGRGHSVTSAVGSALEGEPWIAVEQAAWESLAVLPWKLDRSFDPKEVHDAQGVAVW